MTQIHISDHSGTLRTMLDYIVCDKLDNYETGANMSDIIRSLVKTDYDKRVKRNAATAPQKDKGNDLPA